MSVIISFVSETDDIPLGEGVRRNFGDEYLKEKDKRAREISKSARGELDAACMKIINEFSKK